MTYSAAASTASDIILEETDTQYDAAGDATFTTTYQRYDDAPATYGALDALGAGDSRASYTASWFDGLGRQTAQQNFGAAASPPTITPTNGQPVTDATAPPRSRSPTTTPAAKFMRRSIRRATRLSPRTTTVARPFGPSRTTVLPPPRTRTSRPTTPTIPTPPAQLLTYKEVTTTNPNGTTQTQITAYVYGSATGLSNAAISRDDLVRAVITGVSVSQLSSLVQDINSGWISGLDVVEYQYDREGEVTQMTDQNGTTHQYTLDQLGRQVSDAVPHLGNGNISNSVMRIDTAYAFDGNVALTTSYSSAAGGTANIVNQVADSYNAFGLLTEEQQSLSGAVDPGTPAVFYTYSTNPATPTRLVGMTYPNGRQLIYGYNSGTDAAVGRVSFLEDGNSGTPLVQYRYLGLDQIDDVDLPQPSVDYNLGQKDANGNLDCVNQFGEVTDQVFAELGAANIEEMKYGYNVSGDELWEANPTSASNGVYLDELYAYNSLNELTGASQGQLNATDTAIAADPGLDETWTLDGMGNWSTYTQSGGPAGNVNQNRQTNSLNQIENYNNPSGGKTSNWAAPVYDNGGATGDGNMTSMPQPGNETQALGCVYDAWNRLVSVTTASGTVRYAYLCLCQLAVADFSALPITRPAKLTQPLRRAVVSRSFCYRPSQGTSRCSFAHRSMAA